MLTAYINKTLNFNTGLSVSALNINSKSSPEGYTKSIDPDSVFVEKAKQGNIDAFRELVLRYQQRAFSIALGVVKNEADAEDIVQEAFVKAHRNLPSFRGDSSFYTWFYRIVFNLAIDLSRKKYRQTETSIPEEKDLDYLNNNVTDAVGHYVGNIDNPAKMFDRAELQDQINVALDNLSAEHKAVIILREVEGLSYSEISDVVGCSKGTVMSRLHHARKRMKTALSKYVGNKDVNTNTENEVTEEE